MAAADFFPGGSSRSHGLTSEGRQAGGTELRGQGLASFLPLFIPWDVRSVGKC